MGEIHAAELDTICATAIQGQAIVTGLIASRRAQRSFSNNYNMLRNVHLPSALSLSLSSILHAGSLLRISINSSVFFLSQREMYVLALRYDEFACRLQGLILKINRRSNRSEIERNENKGQTQEMTEHFSKNMQKHL